MTAEKGFAEHSWIDRHRTTWRRKSVLRDYYRNEFFKRIVSAIPPGRTLEIGSGPGFFAEYHRCDVVTDVTDADHVDQVVDIHHTPFADGEFAAVIGVDVIHHFYHPAAASREIARILQPGGRLILIEPWSGPFGYFFNKYLHHEDCSPLDDPWGPAFTNGKDAMDGNATIPKTLFVDHADELLERTGLKVVSVETFGCVGYIATGGFQRWGLPEPLARLIIAAERHVPSSIWPTYALKTFIVAERCE